MDSSYVELPLDAAAGQCTFALLVPAAGALPADCSLSPTASLRLERPPDPSVADPVWKENTVASGDLNAVGYKSGGVPPWTTMRNSCAVLHVQSSDGARALRLKEYLFLDYGPHPTHHAMIPPVGSYVAKTALTPGPRAEFHIGDRSCGWLGLDYAGRPVAQVMLRGTCVEVRVARGSFEDEELTRVCCGLGGSASPCFAQATYYARHPAVAHGFLVPCSLWAADVSNFGLPHCAFPIWVDAASAPGTVATSLGELALDSYGVLGGSSAAKPADEATGPMETLALYTDAGRDSMAWVRTVRHVGPKQEAPRWPPEPGAYPCEVPLRRHAGRDYDLFTAHVTTANGPHCAALRRGDQAATYVHATPRPGLSADMFVGMVERLFDRAS